MTSKTKRLIISLVEDLKKSYFGYIRQNGDFIHAAHSRHRQRISASFGTLSDKARHEPVVITKPGRDSLVVMSAEEWERLKRRDRQVGLKSPAG